MTASSKEDLEEFTITFRREIVFYLRQLINDGTQTNIMFNEGSDTILTVLLDVDEEKGVLVFDWGGSEETNRRFLKSERNIFIARPNGIRNQFVTGMPWETTHQKRRAFAVKLPDKYVRLQRREYFRLTLPMTQRPPCILQGQDGREMTLEVVDIGLGGLALETPSLTIPCETGQTFPRARIDLKNHGILHLDIVIRHVAELTKGKKQVVRLGCMFNKLSPAQDNQLQRYITQVQREERAKQGL
ncbi:flagellar brake protein [Denitratisoma oestradiolicum]|uniref:Flagellar brake protein YcgR n=1 Tax=Denitratisoma oestradiolicum TaxID=311182 RepID=A0A6S6XWN6_9PROT|nr:flagellar brake protein [Denitratisoma oestradiolicum]TWO81450.1 hypothetical protein CBW56_04895 [Denitratisoma oestradiolicum]CAB1368653.1 Flagellar brake protein YcgR [Denitratisoma oestradiolicum]